MFEYITSVSSNVIIIITYMRVNVCKLESIVLYYELMFPSFCITIHYITI